MAEPIPKILVVDDYAYNRLVYSEWLREIGGVEIVEAASGQRALQLARDHDFAMFLIDVNMPDLNGLELAHLLRQEPRAQSTPIIFVTSEHGDGGRLMQGYRMGAVDFVVSGPLHAQILAEKARVFVELYRKRLELQGIAEHALRESLDLKQRVAQLDREHEALRRHATRDGMTGLPNRALFHDRLHAALARASRNSTRTALAYLEFDGFRELNERHGQAAGDALIVATADRLTAALRATDTVARLGPEEFAILLEELGSPSDVQYVIQKIHGVVVEPLVLQASRDSPRVKVRVGASLGAAVYPDHANEVDGLITLAAMTIRAVKAGSGGAKVYPGHAHSHRAIYPANADPE